MNVINRNLLPLLALLVLPVLQAHAARTAFSVVDAGVDGEQRYYRVICPSGKQGSVTHFYQTGRICMYPVMKGKKEKCLDKWDIDAAAKEACE